MIPELITEGVSAANSWREISHNIEWWAVSLAGTTIGLVIRSLTSEWATKMPPRLQQLYVWFVKFVVVPFCVMLILIQFEPIWMNWIEEIF